MMRARTGPKITAGEVGHAAAKEDACYHFSRFLDENIARITHALEEQSGFASMTKLKGIDREHAHDAVELVFNSCRNMDRLDRAFAALGIISGGVLHPDLVAIHQQILQTREKMKQVRQNFYPPICYAEQRIRTDLTAEIGPLCDLLKSLVIAYYTVAKSLYDLPELNGEGMK